MNIMHGIIHDQKDTQIQTTNVNPETEDLSAKEHIGFFQSFPVSFRRLAVHSRGTKLWLALMN